MYFSQNVKNIKIFYWQICIIWYNIQKGIIGLMLDRPKITQEEMSNLLGVTPRTIRNHIKYLIDNDYIERVGANKNGKWKVVKNGSDKKWLKQ